MQLVTGYGTKTHQIHQRLSLCKKEWTLAHQPVLNLAKDLCVNLKTVCVLEL